MRQSGTSGASTQLQFGTSHSAAPSALLFAAFTVALVVLAFPFGEGKRIILTSAILLVLAWHLFSLSSSGLAVAFLYLSILGGIRRFLIPYLGWAGFEPMLLVPALITGLFFCGLILRRKIPFDTPMAKWIFWLIIVMLLQIFNPRQGGIIVGIAGMLYMLVPLLWYYVGRHVAKRESIQLLLTVTIVISILSAMDGLRQTFVGLNSSENYWLNIALGSAAANIYHFGGLIRAFGFSTSAEEYAFLIGVGFVLCWARFVTGSKVALFGLPLLAVAIFWESSRGVMVTSLFACSIIWALLSGSNKVVIVRSAVALLLGSIGLTWSMQAIKGSEANLDAKQKLIVLHQTNGILDTGHSTAVNHSEEIVKGVSEAFVNPVGRGLGATNIAGGKFGNSPEVYGTEFDISDAFAGLGLVGGIIYLVIVCRVFYTSIKLWRATRDPVALAIVGTLIMLTGRWIEGIDGSLTMLTWSLVGYVDIVSLRMLREERLRAQEATVQAPVAAPARVRAQRA